MFVLNPDSFLLPTYRISPFRTEDAERNAGLVDDTFATEYFNNRFGKDSWTYTYNGREAIGLALATYNLQLNDVVTILTTSGNQYISSCVTREIELFCKWNREVTDETRVIFVNHEFGYPYPDMDKLKSLGLPIIEDCCTTFFSQDDKGKLGKYGDFSVYSFPKFFPIQIGGLLVKNNSALLSEFKLYEDQVQYIRNVLSFQLAQEEFILERRKEIFQYAVSQFSSLGFSLRFESKEKIVPSILMLRNKGIVKDLNKLKLFFSSNGVQSSIFYGEDVFFIPIHQNLSKRSIDYFIQLVLFFIKSKNIYYNV